jgi:hypothetical protein
VRRCCNRHATAGWLRVTIGDQPGGCADEIVGTNCGLMKRAAQHQTSLNEKWKLLSFACHCGTPAELAGCPRFGQF